MNYYTTLNGYQEKAAEYANEDLSQKEAMITFTLGLSGESGEVADLIKKHLGHGHPLDEEKVKKELGDVLWYVSQLANYLGMSLEDVASTNIAKLEARYAEGFSTDASINRVA